MKKQTTATMNAAVTTNAAVTGNTSAVFKSAVNMGMGSTAIGAPISTAFTAIDDLEKYYSEHDTTQLATDYATASNENVKGVILDVLRGKVKAQNAEAKIAHMKTLLTKNVAYFATHRRYKTLTVKVVKGEALKAGGVKPSSVVFGESTATVSLAETSRIEKSLCKSDGIPYIPIIADSDSLKLYLDIFTDNLALLHGFMQSDDCGKARIKGGLRYDRTKFDGQPVTYYSAKARFDQFTRQALYNQLNVIFMCLLGPDTNLHPRKGNVDDIIKLSYNAIKNACAERKISGTNTVLDMVIDAIEERYLAKGYDMVTGVKPAAGKVDGKKELVEDAKETAKADLLKMVENADAKTLAAIADVAIAAVDKIIAKKAKTA